MSQVCMVPATEQFYSQILYVRPEKRERTCTGGLARSRCWKRKRNCYIRGAEHERQKSITATHHNVDESLSRHVEWERPEIKEGMPSDSTAGSWQRGKTTLG